MKVSESNQLNFSSTTDSFFGVNLIQDGRHSKSTKIARTEQCFKILRQNLVW